MTPWYQRSILKPSKFYWINKNEWYVWWLEPTITHVLTALVDYVWHGIDLNYYNKYDVIYISDWNEQWLFIDATAKNICVWRLLQQKLSIMQLLCLFKLMFLHNQCSYISLFVWWCSWKSNTILISLAISRETRWVVL